MNETSAHAFAVAVNAGWILSAGTDLSRQYSMIRHHLGIIRFRPAPEEDRDAEVWWLTL